MNDIRDAIIILTIGLVATTGYMCSMGFCK